MRAYLTLDQFSRRAIGRFWVNRMRGLNNPVDIIYEAIADAGQEADDFVRRHLGAPGKTTVTSVYGNQITVPSVLGFDSSSGIGVEHWIQTQDGNFYKVLDVEVLDYTSPFPGILTVTPTPPGYASGTTVQGVFKERVSVYGVGTNFADTAGMVTQEGQSAEAHSPRDMISQLVRNVWITSPPIQSILAINVVLRWGATALPIPISNLAINVEQGWFRLPIGVYVVPGSDIEVFYIGGYQTISRSMQNAVALLVADNLANGIPPVALGYATSEVGGSRVTSTVKARRGRLIDDETSTLRGLALQKLEPHIRATP